MERKLSSLFDYQHFQQNRKLKSVIQRVEGHYAAALDDDDLALVSAAGGSTVEDPDENEDSGYGDFLRTMNPKK